MYHLNILPIAFEDIKSNANCYSTQKKGLGLKFTRAVRSEIKKIIKNPKEFKAYFLLSCSHLSNSK